MWTVSADPLDFEEAIAWHRKRVPVTDKAWTKLTKRARKKAFKVAGVAQLDLVTEVWDAIDRAIADGTTLSDFKEEIGPKLRDAWQGSIDKSDSRLETIFRTNVQLAYAAGRHEQASDPDILETRPYWMFDAVLDSRTSDLCEACNGTVRPADDPWWNSHLPPLHFNCRSTFTTLTGEQAAAEGVTARAPRVRASEGFGEPPAEEDDWEPQASDYTSDLWDLYQAKGE